MIDDGMQPLAVAHLVNGNKEHAEAAKRVLLGIVPWAGQDLYSANREYGDEPGLSVC